MAERGMGRGLAAILSVSAPEPGDDGAELRDLAVALTVISGADYFLNVRKRIEEARRGRIADQAGGTRSTS